LIANILAATEFVTREANNGQVFLDQPEAALFGIKALIGLIPGVAMIIGAILLHWYPLRGKYLEKVQKDVLALHAKKHAQLENQ
jgi:Na+/melibiose symporter-like transporter